MKASSRSSLSRIRRKDLHPPCPPDPAVPIQWTRHAFQRPRLFATPREFQDLRKRLQRPVESEMLARLRKNLELRMKEGFPSLQEDHEINRRPPVTWQIHAALLFALTREKKYMAILRRLLSPILGLDTRLDISKSDLAAGYALSMLAFCHDLLHEEWSAREHRQLMDFVNGMGTSFFSQTAVPLGFWSADLMQNHCMTAWGGIGQAGMAFHQEIPAAKEWAQWSQRIFRTVSWLQPPDGSNMEGPSYGSFGNERRLMHYESALRCLGENLYSPGERQCGYWYLHNSLPGARPGLNAFPWGDNSFRTDVHGPVHTLLALARAYRDPVIQGFAMEYWRRGIGEMNSELTWLNLFNYDPSLPEKPHHTQPLSLHFTDLDMICSRSGWTDPDATAVSFLCGPFQGHRATTKTSDDMGAAHSHADTASLQLFSKGEFLLLDPGYELVKRTHHHNTILVDDVGQLGEGIKWFNVNRVLHYKGWAEVLDFKDHGDSVGWTADAAQIYPPEAELTRFHRHVLFIRPDILVVLDDLAAKSPKKFTQLWHSGRQFKKIKTSGTYGFTHHRASLTAKALPLPGFNQFQVASEKMKLSELKRPGDDVFELQIQSPVKRKWRFLTVFCVGNSKQNHPFIQAKFSPRHVELNLGGAKYRLRFDLKECKAPTAFRI